MRISYRVGLHSVEITAVNTTTAVGVTLTPAIMLGALRSLNLTHSSVIVDRLIFNEL